MYNVLYHKPKTIDKEKQYRKKYFRLKRIYILSLCRVANTSYVDK